MDKLVIEGKHRLSGSVKTSGAKNSALPILFASILTPETCFFENVPDLADISTTLKLLEQMGVHCKSNSAQHTAELRAQNLTSLEAPYELVRTMRASVLVLGPTLARFGEAKVSLPGGCSIGARPVNLHLSALEKMGAEIQIDSGYILAKAKKLRGAEISFDQVSVGATENTMMAATLADGCTVLHNAAREPEIVDLANFLRKMGAKISGEGTSVITIEGGRELKSTTHSIIPDRIEAGTYLIAAAMSGGDVHLPGFDPYLLSGVLEKLEQAGTEIKKEKNSVRLISKNEVRSVDFSTAPFPGFATDMQAQFMALMCVANGTSVVSENIFENRFMHVAELSRLGADITIQGPTAIVRGLHGKDRGLKGATVMATDLRASACLVLAGLAAEGTTVVRRIYHLDRGYEKMEEKLRGLGAVISRAKE